MNRTSIALAIGLALAFSNVGLAQTPEPFTLHPLDHGVSVAIDNPAAKQARSGSNAGFIIGPNGVAVVDTFESAAAAGKMLASIQAQTKLPIRFVINTHYHLDHVAGNEVFSSAGAVVMAQESVRTWERTENLKFFGAQITADQRKLVETLGLPDVTYKLGATVYLGDNRSLVLRAMPGHTGGDTVVYDAEANVVFCGDLFWNHTLPNLIDASTKQWIETLDTLLADYPSATFVPGHGDEIGHAADVRAFRDYLEFLRESIKHAQAHGESGDALVKTVLPALKEKYGSWNFFDFAESDIRRTDEELRGVKTIPQPASKTP
jgi:glyoxylase-like metal-dependent hydrolase (beta-lactamase superfamily II)